MIPAAGARDARRLEKSRLRTDDEYQILGVKTQNVVYEYA